MCPNYLSWGYQGLHVKLANKKKTLERVRISSSQTEIIENKNINWQEGAIWTATTIYFRRVRERCTSSLHKVLIIYSIPYLIQLVNILDQPGCSQLRWKYESQSLPELQKENNWSNYRQYANIIKNQTIHFICNTIRCTTYVPIVPEWACQCVVVSMSM